MLPSEIAGVSVGSKCCRGRKSSRLGVPGFAPLEGFVGEVEGAGEGRDFDEVFDEFTFRFVVVRRLDRSTGVCSVMTLRLTVDEDNAASNALGEKGSRKVILHPHGSCSTNDIEPRILNVEVSAVLRCVLERAFFAVPDVGEERYETAIVGAKESTEFTNGACEWGHGDFLIDTGAILP